MELNSKGMRTRVRARQPRWHYDRVLRLFYIYATAAALVFPRFCSVVLNRKSRTDAVVHHFRHRLRRAALGGVAFGIGDRLGRKATLVGSLMLMGGTTMVIWLAADLRIDRIIAAPSCSRFLGLSRELGSAASGAGRL